MNTVGKRAKLGEQVRCVVSVSMLTEGWDANTVTHILGVRAFGSQLLCEQVVGRGLRRRTYAVNDARHVRARVRERLRHPVPVHLLRQAGQGPAAAAAGRSRSAPSTAARSCGSSFPKLDGYRVELPDDEICSTSTTPRCSRSDRTRCRAGSRWAASSATRRARARRPRAVPPAAGRLRARQAVLDARLQHRGRQSDPGSSRGCVEICRTWIERVRDDRPAATASGT